MRILSGHWNSSSPSKLTARAPHVNAIPAGPPVPVANRAMPMAWNTPPRDHAQSRPARRRPHASALDESLCSAYVQAARGGVMTEREAFAIA
jgi:hypothetical protein